MRPLPALCVLVVGLAATLAMAEEKPLPRFAPEKVEAALKDAGTIFEGTVVEADLEYGIFPGYLGVHCKRVIYEVTDPVKGSFPKKVEVWFMLAGGEIGGDYMEQQPKAGSAPRLDPKLFAKGSTHLLFCLKEKEAGPKWKDWFRISYGEDMKRGEAYFVLMVTPEVKDAKAKAKAKVEGTPGQPTK